jgi:endonuclease YncB( thermonuclease family)
MGNAMAVCFRILFFTLVLFSVSPSVRSEPIDKSEIVVVDGDTIDARGHRWRMIGYDTPETRSTWRKVAPVEKMAGEAATERFKELLQSGRLDLAEKRCGCSSAKIAGGKCNRGRKCGLLTRDGENIGKVLIQEKLAVEFVCSTSRCPKMPDWPAILSARQHPSEN